MLSEKKPPIYLLLKGSYWVSALASALTHASQQREDQAQCFHELPECHPDIN